MASNLCARPGGAHPRGSADRVRVSTDARVWSASPAKRSSTKIWPMNDPRFELLRTDTLDADGLRQLLEVGRAIIAEHDLDALLERVLLTACELTGAQYAALGVLDSDRKSLERFVTRGIDEETQEAIGPLPRGHGVLGTLIRDPRPLRLPDVGTHPDSWGFPAGHPPMTTFLGVPIVVRGEAFG